MTSTSVLYKTDDGSVVIVDIPRSLEEAQVLPGQAPSSRIISCEPVSKPFDTPEPKDGSLYAASASQATQLDDLMTSAAVEHVLDQLARNYHGDYYRPRIVDQRTHHAEPEKDLASHHAEHGSYHQPPNSYFHNGPVQSLVHSLGRDAAKFNVILLDPPWPNRSAVRKKDGYKVSNTVASAKDTLKTIPMKDLLAKDGLVAIWITNKSSARDCMLSPSRGLLAHWGLELVTEWTWLKVTTSGEPVYPVDSKWRKPWEKLLLAKQTGSPGRRTLKPRVVVAVPDVHSRKPNPRCLFQDLLEPDSRGLEIFARNLTAGWWSCGDEVLKFQQREHWASS